MCAHTHTNTCVGVCVCVCVSHLRWQLRRLLQMAALKAPGQENDDDDDDKRIKMEMKCQSSPTAALVFQPPPLLSLSYSTLP